MRGWAQDRPSRGQEVLSPYQLGLRRSSHVKTVGLQSTLTVSPACAVLFVCVLQQQPTAQAIRWWKDD